LLFCLISPMPPEMAVIKELERGTLSMLSDLQSYKNMLQTLI
jgi:hypothetical protein